MVRRCRGYSRTSSLACGFALNASLGGNDNQSGRPNPTERPRTNLTSYIRRSVPPANRRRAAHLSSRNLRQQISGIQRGRTPPWVPALGLSPSAGMTVGRDARPSAPMRRLAWRSGALSGACGSTDIVSISPAASRASALRRAVTSRNDGAGWHGRAAAGPPVQLLDWRLIRGGGIDDATDDAVLHPHPIAVQ
jgi:hypothetical protein